MVASKPWRVEKKPPHEQMRKPQINGKRNTSLISPSKLSFPTQRLLVTAMFFMLQGFKLASVKSTANAFLFSALDVGFVYYLPVLAIPRLHFRGTVVVAQCLLLLLLNYTVFISSAWVSVAFYLLLHPILALLGLAPSESGSSQLQSGLISGKYVVDILPEATAKLDTIAPLCIDTQSSRPVALRLSVNGTWPSALKLSRAELGDNEKYSRLQFGPKQIRKFPQDNKRELYIPISEPGAYYLDGITDEETGLRVKIERNRVLVPPCPSAQIDLVGPQDVCLGGQLSAEVWVEGMAPIEAVIDGKTVKLGEELNDDGVGRFMVPVEKTVGELGGSFHNFDVEVTGVKDKIGCEARRLPGRRAIHVTAPPRGLVAPSQNLPKVGESDVAARIEIKGEDAPFEIEFDGPEGVFTHRFPSAGTHLLGVSALGEYKAIGLKGSKCGGSAAGSFSVFSPPPVSLAAEFISIEDRCAGPSGVDARVKLEGSSPWKVGVRTLKGSRVISQGSIDFESSESPSNIIQFRPKSIGEFTYEIEYVQDRYRRVDLHPSGENLLRTTQNIKELPGAKFGAISTSKLCGDSSMFVDVVVRGRGPFTLAYSVDDTHDFQRTTEDNQDSASIRLDLDLKSGVHFVRLKSLTDRNGCVTDLGGIRTQDIVVRNEISSLALKMPGEYKSADPVNMKLPLQTFSALYYPAKLVYEHLDTISGRKSVHSRVLNSDGDLFIPANSAGVYKLVSLDDGICGGSIVGDNNVQISLYDRPKIELVGYEEGRGLCHNMGSVVGEFNLIGEAPFVVTHEVVDPTGKSHVSKTKVTKKHFNTDLDSSMTGEYTHYLWVADSQYTMIQQAQHLKFTHRVWAPAQARFSVKQPHLEACENTMLGSKVPVLLKGDAPFQLTVEVGGDVKVISVPNARDLDLRSEIGTLSGYNENIKVNILEVVDKHGCRAPQPKTGSSLVITVLPQPVVPQLSKTDYCVGEVVSFPIKGRGSAFDVQYKHNSKVRNAKVTLDGRKRSFDIPGNVPGNLTLVSVSDENGCTLSTDVTAQVHKRPSSTITEEPHFSIYEGDKISLGFAFEGTAPFSFVYVHTVNGRVKERKEVRDVMENVYTLIVDEGGEYEIVELKDRFCKSVREVF